ncbi:hypothetical protein GEMRC1_009190 [Eukaryota sp. GEM-RC1]
MKGDQLTRPVFMLCYFCLFICFVTVCAALTETNRYFDAIPHYLATVRADQPTTFSAKCFKLTTATLTVDSHKAIISINSQKAESFHCLDWFLISNGRTFKLKAAIKHGDHKLVIPLSDKEEQIIGAGFHIFQISLNFIDYFRDVLQLYNVLKLKDPVATQRLVEAQLGIKYQKRSVSFIDPRLMEPHIQSGDVIVMTNFNDNEALIMIGSLSRSGHAAMFLRHPDTNQLYVIEAQPDDSEEPFPFGHDIFKTKFEDWLTSVVNGSYYGCNPSFCHAIHLPLSDEFRSHFNNRKAWEYYMVAEKHYPYSTFGEFFAAADSTDPKSWAFPLNPMLIPFVGILADSFMPDFRDQYLLKGYEKRLDLPEGHFTAFSEILEHCDKHGIDIIELSAVPEQDSWTYNGLPALQCSSLVVSILRASGAIDGVTKGKAHLINAVEFHPRDIYSLGIYKSGRPSVCDVDDLPYCQLVGDNIIELPGWNSVPMYPNMNERCFINPVSPRMPAQC